MNKKVLIVISCMFLIIICLATTSMIEFYYAKKLDRMPILSLKSEDKVKQYYKYSSFFYNVYKCYSGYTTVQPFKKEQPYCPRVIKYDKNDNYTNSNGLLINKKNYQMILNTSATMNEIETWTTNEQVQNAVLVAEEYGKSLYKEMNDKQIKLVVFSKFMINNEYGDYEWIYQENDPKYYKCMKDNTFKEYENGICKGEWKKHEFSEKWCELAQNSSIVKIKEAYISNCK